MSFQYKVAIQRNEYRGKKIARLNISVGQPYHEGEKLAAQVEWVCRHFDQSTINLCDALQRHNFECMGILPDRAMAMALASGDAWLERNQSIIDALPNQEIIRWDYWLSHPEWAEAMNKARNIYANDSDIQKSLDATALAFARKKQEHINKPLEEILKFSRQYLLEEMAFILISSYPEIADIYPGTYPPIFDLMRERGHPAPVSMTTMRMKRSKVA